MDHETHHYVNGAWMAPLQPIRLDVIDPSTEEAFTRIAVGGPADVDRAVAAAKAAFPAFARTTRKNRLDLLRAISANETVYGLAAYVQSPDLAHARRVAAEMRAGNVHVNYPAWDTAAPFGGYKQSGNGREYGKWALDEFCEINAVIGYEAA